jgi:hypothetical protein
VPGDYLSPRCQFFGLSWSLFLVLPAGYSFLPASQPILSRSQRALHDTLTRIAVQDLKPTGV